MDFSFGSGAVADECTRSTMLASERATYEVRRIPRLRACMSRVGGVLQRCAQECWGDTWESRHAYLDEHEELVASLGLDYEEGS